MIFKPKKFKILVPGVGVVAREDFEQSHLDAVLKQIVSAGLDRDAYLSKNFDVVSYGDLPLFKEEAAEEAPAEDATTDESVEEPVEEKKTNKKKTSA